MRSALFILFLFSVTLTAEPYERVLVFSGGSHQVATFLGSVEYAKENDWDPDLIIATCGSSVACQVMNLSDDPKEWKRIIKSKEFYEALKKEKINEKVAQGLGALNLIGGQAMRHLKKEAEGRPPVEFIPDAFSPGLLDIPTEDFPDMFDKKFSSTRGIPAIVVAARLNYGPEDVGKRRDGKKLLTEVYFTDEETAKHLKGLKSPVGEQFPDSAIDTETDVITDKSLAFAMRASISEPRLLNIMKEEVDGKTVYYMAGSVNSYPNELGKRLGKEVIATRIGYISDLETMVGENYHGFNMNDRRVEAQKIPMRAWMDRSDATDVEHLEPKKRFNSTKLLHLVSGIPETHEEFQKIMDTHWEWGRKRMKEALDSKENSIDHIRKESPKKAAENGLFKKMGQGVSVNWAPLVTMDTIRSELAESLDEDESELEGLSEALMIQGPAMGAFIGGTGLLELLRYLLLPHNANKSGLRKATEFTVFHLLGLRNAGTVTRLLYHGANKGISSCAQGFRKMSGTH